MMHIYPITERISTGDLTLVLEAEYDVGFGTLVASKDINGHQTHYGYDFLARLKFIVSPGGNSPDTFEQPTMTYDYVLAATTSCSDGTYVVSFLETRKHE